MCMRVCIAREWLNLGQRRDRPRRTRDAGDEFPRGQKDGHGQQDLVSRVEMVERAWMRAPPMRSRQMTSGQRADVSLLLAALTSKCHNRIACGRG